MQFENSVISFGSKTDVLDKPIRDTFENSVISFGSKTDEVSSDVSKEFENSVIIFAVKIISDKKRAICSKIARFSN